MCTSKKQSETFNRLICVTNRHLFDDIENAGGQPSFLARLEQIAAAHPAGIVLREKDMEEVAYEALAREVQAICRRHQVPFIAHTYARVAVHLGADGLHLPLPLLRRLRESGEALPAHLGTSCHSLADVREAKRLGCSYLIAGHIYATSCKPGLPPRGLAFLREVTAATELPVYAIGGITPARLREVLAAGAAGGCAMSSLMRGELWLPQNNR
ncbi:thiamine phosphate synthase [Mitsuokella multacida]|uniref:Thiamine phosphate synthase n=1 Tax=Mitsuokella multacida TaxID=52226 RepID=A0A414NWS2_9FIRM|nr:thiamine phosphate synthase [Mitsuokella multacida]RHF51578.1 thiamine phosphate synthase [Mitsuokella multacida]